MRRRFLILFLSLAASSFGAVTRIELVDRGDVLEGAPQGTAGAYERVAAKVYFSVDPKLAANRVIADIDLAQRNERGQVEFSADLYILKPRDPAKSNGTALVEISNRGGKGLLGMFDYAVPSPDPKEAKEFGDGFLLQQGFTLVWVGWEFDVPTSSKLLGLRAPLASDHGQPIHGLVMSEWVGDKRVTRIPLGDRFLQAYEVSDPNARGTQLTVRDGVTSERHVIPRDKWKFAGSTEIEMESGFEPGKIYEAVYQAKNPVLVGLGPAAVRDLVSFLKYGGTPTLLGDQRKYMKRALGFGVSQSGRFLRTFLKDGFNEDEQSRRVFDGVWAHVGGAGQGSFNFRFAQPSRDGHPFLNVLYPTDVPPFNEQDGMLARAEAAHVVPKIFLSNGSYEYWGRAASLIHTSEDGKSDVTPGKEERIYFFAGSQHGAGSVPPRKLEAQNLADTNDYRPAMRALLLAMQAWLKDGVEPPASQYPRIGNEQLVPLSGLAFPHIPNVHVPQHKREAYRLDWSSTPPKVGAPYPTLVPQVDQDGNETSGVKMPAITVPLATYTGWNLRSPAIGAPDELYSMVGSWIPFPRTKAEAQRLKDPRRSLEERYPSKRDYLEKITSAAQQMASQGFLLDVDVPRIRERAAAEWDYSLRSN
ncbi:MAG: alpha/beta hydrolase domain-containing protein [Acidobacteriota bacterium]|nr:alpha/beta hydrolase domain-containing protein [Acidobacteriota bacterium]